jgi:hypothetical protein
MNGQYQNQPLPPSPLPPPALPSQNQPANQSYALTNLGEQIAAHWQKYRPTMYQALKSKGQLRQAVYEAQEQTADLLTQLISQQGMRYDEAWEVAREIAFLPDEEELPMLGENNPLSAM